MVKKVEKYLFLMLMSLVSLWKGTGSVLASTTICCDSDDSDQVCCTSSGNHWYDGACHAKEQEDCLEGDKDCLS